MAGNIWGEGPRGGIFGARVDPALLRELEKRAEAKRQMAQGLESAAAEQPIDARPTFEKSLGGRILAAPSKLFGGLIVDPAVEGITDLLTLTGNVKRGEQPTMSADPQTGEMHTDPRLIERTANAAGTLTGGGVATAGGRAGVGVFGGRLAKTANLEKLKIAEEMAAKGAYPDEIWEVTGWFKGPDDQWRFEIPDEAARLEDFAREDIAKGNEYPLGGFGGKPGSYGGPALSHPELFAAYPELGAVRLHSRVAPGNKGTSWGDSIGLASRSSPAMRGTLLHELQHEVQDIENFTGGGNALTLSPNTPAWDIYQERRKAIRTPLTREQFDASGAGGGNYTYERYLKEQKASLRRNAQAFDLEAQRYAAYEAYRRLAGEVEARNVTKRADWDAQKRYDIPPAFSEDVPRDEQIVRSVK